MLKSLSVIAACALIAAGMSFAKQSTPKVIIPVDRTGATDAKQMFTSYCAPCHGVDGKGHGPAAAALQNRPTDLTALRHQNQGKFPDTHIVAVLQFGPDSPAHQASQMPAWAPIFAKMNRSNPQDKQLRISNLTRYLESIQRD